MGKPFMKLIAISTFLLVCLTTMTVQAGPKLAWSEDALDVEALIGTVVVKTVSFTPQKDITNLSFKIGDECEEEDVCASRPELASQIEVVQVTSGPARAGKEIQLAVAFSIPSDTPEGEYIGTLHIRDGKRTIAKPLAVRLSVTLPSMSIIPEGISKPSTDRLYLDLQTNGEYVLGEALVGFNQGTSREEIVSTIALYGGVFLGSIPELDLYQIGLPHAIDPGLLNQAIELLAEEPNIGLATNSWISSARLYPDDGAGYEEEYWQRSDWPQTKPYTYVGLPEAWDISTGSDAVNIAVIDFGFYWDHEDLTDNVAFRGYYISNLLATEGSRNHGTLVAGIIGAVGNNRVGMPGVLWDASLMLFPVQIPLIDKKASTASVISASVDAINRGARIINYSGGTCSTSVLKVDEENAVWKRLVEGRGKNVLFVFATGNSSECNEGNATTYQKDRYSSPSGLASEMENVVSVTNIGVNYSTNEFENVLGGFGGTVSIAAPGDFYSSLTNNLGGAGTSFASPLVAGVAGLMLSVNETLTPQQIKRIIIESAKKPERKLANEEIYVMDAAAAVSCAQELADNPAAAIGACATQPPRPITDTVTVNGKEWLQPDLFTNLSWNDINAVCPVPSGVCSGTLNGHDMAGWTWASVTELNSLFNYYIGSDVLGPGPSSYVEDNPVRPHPWSEDFWSTGFQLDVTGWYTETIFFNGEDRARRGALEYYPGSLSDPPVQVVSTGSWFGSATLNYSNRNHGGWFYRAP